MVGRVSPVSEYNLAVVRATADYPQSAPGVALVGGVSMGQIRDREYTGAEYTRDDIGQHPTAFDAMVILTGGIHKLFGTPENRSPGSKRLKQAVRFADGIIRIGIREGVIAFAEGRAAGGLRLPTEDDHHKFAEVTQDPAVVDGAEKVFNFAATVAHRPGGPALALAKIYRGDLLENNDALVKGEVTPQQHAETKGRLAGALGEGVYDLVAAELHGRWPRELEGVGERQAYAALNTIFLAMPNPEIEQHYFPRSSD